MASSGRAPGHPGIPPRWTSSAKSGVGTAVDAQSRVWFTLSHGIVNEVYFPRLDQANTRDLGLIVTDRRTFFSEEKRAARSRVAPLAQGVPGYRVTNECVSGRYRIVKLLGFVNSAPGFTQQHVVMDGASALLVSLFGDRGVHARSSIGVASETSCMARVITS